MCGMSKINIINYNSLLGSTLSSRRTFAEGNHISIWVPHFNLGWMDSYWHDDKSVKSKEEYKAILQLRKLKRKIVVSLFPWINSLWERKSRQRRERDGCCDIYFPSPSRCCCWTNDDDTEIAITEHMIAREGERESVRAEFFVFRGIIV